jgi:AcrR family transcriptional regulator
LLIHGVAAIALLVVLAALHRAARTLMRRAGLSPERVVAEAAAVADEVGLRQLTLAAVAQRFGVALPSLYKHVDGLDGLQRDLAVLGMHPQLRHRG